MANPVSAWFFAFMTIPWCIIVIHFAMVTSKIVWATTFIISNAFSVIHAGNHALGYKKKKTSQWYSIFCPFGMLLTIFAAWSIISLGASTFIFLNAFSTIQAFFLANSYINRNKHDE